MVSNASHAPTAPPTHPINTSEWHQAYVQPPPRQLRQVSVDELAEMLRRAHSGNGAAQGEGDERTAAAATGVRDDDATTTTWWEPLQRWERVSQEVLVVDVRRADCESMIPTAINLPAHTLPVSLPSLLPLLSAVPLVVFHCNASRGRGPRAAAWYAEALHRHLLLQRRRAGAADPSTAGKDTGRDEVAVATAAAAEVEQEVARRVGVLVGGIQAWEAKFGTSAVERRGASLEDLDARLVGGDWSSVPL